MSNPYEELYYLKRELKELKKTISTARNSFYCVGGPLNDNIHKFNNEQLKYLLAIANKLKII